MVGNSVGEDSRSIEVGRIERVDRIEGKRVMRVMRVDMSRREKTRERESYTECREVFTHA